MFKSVFVFATLVTASAYGSLAHAEFYTCVFTEPFVTVVYDTAHETLTTDGLGDIFEAANGTARSIVSNDIVYQKNTATGEIHLMNNKGVTLYTLLETGKGSDGMSDEIYPFEVKATSSEFLPQDYVGGCFSDSKPKIEPAPAPDLTGA